MICFFARFREIRKSKSLIYLDKMLLRIEKMWRRGEEKVIGHFIYVEIGLVKGKQRLNRDRKTWPKIWHKFGPKRKESKILKVDTKIF